MSKLNIITIKKFDINKIKKSSNILIIGKRNTGRTTLVKDILYNISNQKFDYGFVFDPIQSDYVKMILDELIYDGYNSDILKGINVI